MIKNQIVGSKRMIYQYCFSHPLGLVWKILTNPSLISILQPNFHNFKNYQLSYQSDSLEYQVGSRFEVKLGGSCLLNVEIDNIIETEYFCQIRWKGTIPNFLLLSFTCLFSFHYLEEYKTMFVSNYNITYHNPESAQLILFDENKKRYMYYMYINNFISTKEYLTMQIETINIKGHFAFARKIMNNVKIIFELIGEMKYCSGDITKEGAVFIFILHKLNPLTKEMILIIKIDQIKIENRYMKLKLTLSDKKNILPKRTITIEVNKNKNNNMLFVFAHKFVRPINEEQINALSVIKKNVLKKLAKIIELNYNKNNTLDGYKI